MKTTSVWSSNLVIFFVSGDTRGLLKLSVEKRKALHNEKAASYEVGERSRKDCYNQGGATHYY